jgi:hypothetical protein
MRKTTVAALMLLGLTLFVFLFAANRGIEQHEPELNLASELTRELAEQLVPGTRVKLLRERGSPKAIVSDPEQFVLLMNATPAEAAWKRDPQGKTFARGLAERAHARYGPDRPVQFVEVVLIQGEQKRRYGFREDRDGNLQTMEVPPLGG